MSPGTEPPLGGKSLETDDGVLLPSAHIRWKLSENDRMTASVARTIRRPDVNQLSPATPWTPEERDRASPSGQEGGPV